MDEPFYASFAWETGDDGVITLDVKTYDNLADVEARLACYPYRNRARVDNKRDYDRLLKVLTGQAVPAL